MRTKSRRRITVDLEESLLQRLDEVAEQVGLSRNQCIADSIEKHLREVRRRLIDDAFLAMADDPEYQADMQAMEAEMAHLSDEAWTVMEHAERGRGEDAKDKAPRRPRA